MAILNSAGSGTSRIGKPNLATLHFFSQIPGEAKFPLARRTVPEAAWRGDDVTVLLEKAVFYRLKSPFLLLPIWRCDDVGWRCYSSTSPFPLPGCVKLAWRWPVCVWGQTLHDTAQVSGSRSRPRRSLREHDRLGQGAVVSHVAAVVCIDDPDGHRRNDHLGLDVILPRGDR